MKAYFGYLKGKQLLSDSRNQPRGFSQHLLRKYLKRACVALGSKPRTRASAKLNDNKFIRYVMHIILLICDALLRKVLPEMECSEALERSKNIKLSQSLTQFKTMMRNRLLVDSN